MMHTGPSPTMLEYDPNAVASGRALAKVLWPEFWIPSSVETLTSAPSARSVGTRYLPIFFPLGELSEGHLFALRGVHLGGFQQVTRRQMRLELEREERPSELYRKITLSHDEPPGGGFSSYNVEQHPQDHIHIDLDNEVVEVRPNMMDEVHFFVFPPAADGERISPPQVDASTEFGPIENGFRSGTGGREGEWSGFQEDLGGKVPEEAEQLLLSISGSRDIASASARVCGLTIDVKLGRIRSARWSAAQK